MLQLEEEEGVGGTHKPWLLSQTRLESHWLKLLGELAGQLSPKQWPDHEQLNCRFDKYIIRLYNLMRVVSFRTQKGGGSCLFKQGGFQWAFVNRTCGFQ